MTEDPYSKPIVTDAPPGADQDAFDSQSEAQLSTKRRGASPYRAQMARANVMLAVLFIGGSAVVYGLLLRRRPAEASAQDQLAEAQVDDALLRISKLAPSGTGKPAPGRITRELLQSFRTEISKHQVPLNRLSKDPFVFVPPLGKVAVPLRHTDTPAGNHQRIDPERETLEQAKARFASLRLQSIMMGRSGSSAIISNNLVTVGQRIEGFTVESITRKAVVLVWENNRFTLKMQ